MFVRKHMKKITSIVTACILTQLSFAQMKEGKIIYERKTNMHKRITPEQESMKNMIPEFSTAKMELLFSATESVFRQLEEEEDIRDEAGGPEERRMTVRMGGNNQVYKNYTTGKVIELRELGPKKYIIEDSLSLLKWKFNEPDTRSIKGYTCKKAITKNQQGSDVVAWYTDEIACPGGPEIFGGLSGMILELNIADGEVVFTAIDITDKADLKMVKAPVNGKKISKKDFQQMTEELFGENRSGGPVIRIMRN